MDLQTDVIGLLAESDYHFGGMGMFDNVVERFMPNTVEGFLLLKRERWLLTQFRLNGQLVAGPQNRNLFEQGGHQSFILQSIRTQFKDQPTHLC
jgi:hypothetical protein